MPMATITKVGGESNLYHVHFLDQRTDPGYGRPGGGHPDQGLPGHGHPDQGLPGSGGRPDQGLPGSGAHPGNRPPGSGGGGIPDNELPDTSPPQLAPGYTLVLIRHDGKWVYAAVAPGSPPPRPLPPGQPGRPDQGLPPHPSQGLPGGPPARPDQGLPPTAQPKPAE
jgi:hypothetical protein